MPDSSRVLVLLFGHYRCTTRGSRLVFEGIACASADVEAARHCRQRKQARIGRRKKGGEAEELFELFLRQCSRWISTACCEAPYLVSLCWLLACSLSTRLLCHYPTTIPCRMSESVYSEGDVFATPAASMFLRPEDGQAGPSSGTAGLRARQQQSHPPAPGEAGRDDSDNWTSSSGETSSLIQRKTVRKQFPASTPRSNKRSNNSNSATPTRRSRKDSSSNQATPKASRDGRSTPTNRTRHRDRREEDDRDETDTPRRRKVRSNQANNLLAALGPLRILANMLLGLLGVALTPVTNAISSFVLLLLILGTAYLALRSPIQNIASLLLPSSLLSIAGPLLSPITILHPASLKTAYCSTIGIGCEVEPLPVARLARTVADQALQAHDIFTSVVALGNPANLGLHHTEYVEPREIQLGLIQYVLYRVWELAVAVKATSDLEDKDRLGNSLKELGDLTRDTKDAMTGLNAQGINAFSWILHEVGCKL